MNTNPILVSIILPTYNRSNLLPKSIESCLNQTYRHIELIIVDDGSTDNTKNIVKTYEDKDSRVKYFKKQNGGLPKALNYGFKHAKGLLFTWTSDDNEYLPNAIETMVKKSLDFASPCLIYTDFWSSSKLNPKELIKLSSQNKLNESNHIGACFLYNREIRDKIGDYDTDLFLAEDYDYWVRIGKKFPIVHIDEPLYIYTYHDGSLTNRRKLSIRLAVLFLKRKHNFIDKETGFKEFNDVIHNFRKARSIELKEKTGILITAYLKGLRYFLI
ncbi:MAG: glycosyltransferase [Candidatus Gastranaerophilaceae bacterium]|jgi:glycosyltransferase involved in cell wall biosynthesis